MKDVTVKNAPDLEGWAIAAAIGLVAFGVSYVAIGLGAMGALAVAGVLFLAVGIFIGMPGERSGQRPVARPVLTHAAAPAMAAPAPSPSPVSAAPAPAARPAGLAEARGGKADDLKLIKGIGPKLEDLCHTLGYYHFDQIAAWTPAEIAWVDDNLEGFKGRVTRDEWVRQAKVLAAGGTV